MRCNFLDVLVWGLAQGVLWRLEVDGWIKELGWSLELFIQSSTLCSVEFIWLHSLCLILLGLDSFFSRQLWGLHWPDWLKLGLGWVLTNWSSFECKPTIVDVLLRCPNSIWIKWLITKHSAIGPQAHARRLLAHDLLLLLLHLHELLLSQLELGVNHRHLLLIRFLRWSSWLGSWGFPRLLLFDSFLKLT